MAEAANNSINFIITGDEDPQMEGQDDPIQEERREELYTHVFEEMMRTVLSSEGHLFNQDERLIFSRYGKLSSDARHILVRLCTRKPEKWFRLRDLDGYRKRFGDRIPDIMDELCRDLVKPIVDGPEREPEVEKIDLTADGEQYGAADSDTPATQAMPVPAQPPAPQVSLIQDQTTVPVVLIKSEAVEVQVKIEDVPFALGTIPAKLEAADRENIDPPVPSISNSFCSDTAPKIEENSQPDPCCLPPQPWEYVVVARDEEHAKIEELLDCLGVDELQPLVRSLKVKRVSKKKPEIIKALITTSSNQTTLSFFPSKTSQNGKARLSLLPCRERQVERLRKLVTDILGKCIRIEPPVRELFLRMQLIYYRSTQYTTQLLTTSILAYSKKQNYEEYKAHRTADIWTSREELVAYENALRLEAEIDGLVNDARGGKGAYGEPGAAGDDDPKAARHRSVQQKFETIYQEWKQLIKEPWKDRGGLERFEYGYVWTRIVCKARHALGSLQQYKYELDVIEHLLTQVRWRRGRRGVWHDRRVLLFTRYLPDPEKAKNAAEEGLKDLFTHSIFRPKLQNRLAKLEKQLEIPHEDCHVPDPGLSDAQEISIFGTRVRNSTGALHLDNMMRPKHEISSHFTIVSSSRSGTPVQQTQQVRNTGKSRWKGGGDEVVSVEELSLQHYKEEGWKGLHSEGRIVYTIFGLLFWDIIFASIPGAFETPFQVAPLDIGTDTFYHSRRELFDKRLVDIKQGKAREILRDVDLKHRDDQTLCAGVRWNLAEREDLENIVEYFGGDQLCEISRIISEEYHARGGGLPDLFLWHDERKCCKFVEVKGPGDKLSENQKTWIDLMVRSGISVEVCYVLEEGTEPPKRTVKKEPKAKNEKATQKPKAKKGKKRKRDPCSDTEEEEWVEQSTPESSQDAYGRRPCKKPRKPQDIEHEPPTAARYSSPEL